MDKTKLPKPDFSHITKTGSMQQNREISLPQEYRNLSTEELCALALRILDGANLSTQRECNYVNEDVSARFSAVVIQIKKTDGLSYERVGLITTNLVLPIMEKIEKDNLEDLRIFYKLGIVKQDRFDLIKAGYERRDLSVYSALPGLMNVTGGKKDLLGKSLRQKPNLTESEALRYLQKVFEKHMSTLRMEHRHIYD